MADETILSKDDVKEDKRLLRKYLTHIEYHKGVLQTKFANFEGSYDLYARTMERSKSLIELYTQNIEDMEKAINKVSEIVEENKVYSRIKIIDGVETVVTREVTKLVERPIKISVDDFLDHKTKFKNKSGLVDNFNIL